MQPHRFLQAFNRLGSLLAVSAATFLAPSATVQAQSLATAGNHNAVVKSDGSLWMWGGNGDGQQGIGGNAIQETPHRIGSDSHWVQVSTGAGHVAAIRSDGTLWTWGRNGSGQLGRNNSIADATPRQVGTVTSWKAVAAGGSHTLAIRTDGSLWVWGSNIHGQLGLGSTMGHSAPVRVGTDTNWRDVAAGENHSIAIRTNGTLWAWGSNTDGQVGNNSFFSQTSPVQLGTATNWTWIAAGWAHSVATRADGTLWVWGRGMEGQLGTGATVQSQRTPIQLGAVNTWGRVAAGSQHTMALRSNGTLWVWGDNFFGQLGDGSQQRQLSPKQIGTDTDWTRIGAGASHSTALKTNGVLWTAGANSDGQLGSGSTDSSSAFAASRFGRPDLALTNVSAAGLSALGQPFTFNAFGANRGSGDVTTSTAFPIQVRLSRAPEWGHSSNVAVGSILVARNLGSGDTFNSSATLNLPSALPSGRYYLGARIGESAGIAEFDFTNNVFWAPEAIPFLADLRVDALAPATQTLQRGQSVTFTIPVRNAGIGDISASTVIPLQVRLSQDRTWGNADDLVLAQSFSITGGLAPNTSRQVSISVTIPSHAPLGSYHLAAWVDHGNVIEESDPDNNVNWSSAANVHIAGPSLAAAVGQPGLTVTTGGAAAWFGQTEFAAPGTTMAGQTPPLAAGQNAWFEASFAGPSRLTFNWKCQTQSQNNYLAVLIDGVESARIVGNVDWTAGSILLPSGSNRVQWRFVRQTAAGGEDRAWVGNIAVTPLEGPDIVITGIDYEAKTYVLQRDAITVQALGMNQGQAIPQLPAGYKVEVRLSKTRVWEDVLQDNIPLGNLDRLQGLGADNRFVYRSTLGLPNHIPAGHYYIGVKADELGNEFDHTNNVRWTALADVVIERRPDLQVSQLVYRPGIYTIQTPAGSAPDKLEVSFNLVNAGLADVPGVPFAVRLSLTPSRDAPAASETPLATFQITEGLHAGQSRRYTVITDLPAGATTGAFLYVKVVADSAGAVPESREDNNTALSDLRDVFVQDLRLPVALNRTDVEWQTGSTLDNPPWYGQKEVFFSQEEPKGAARAPKNMRQGDAAHLDTTVTVQGPSPVSFFWKVSSDQLFNASDQLVAHNYLEFRINGQVMAVISGEVDWRQQTFLLPAAGTYSLRWSYVKELNSSGRADTGWVDRVSYTAPDLVMANVEILGADGQPVSSRTYNFGDTFRYRLTIRNDGQLAVPLNPSYFIQVRLAPTTDTAGNLNWSASRASDVEIERFEWTNVEERTLEPGEQIVLTREVVLTTGFSQTRDYFIGAWVDFTNRIPEGNTNNNLRWSATSNVRLVAPLTLGDALGYSSSHPDGWLTGGSGAWVGQTGDFHHHSDLPGNGSAARSPAIGTNQQAWFQTEVQGPAIMSYSWKVSSRQNFNFLRLYVSGKMEKQIHGQVGWHRETIFIPAGPQTIRWSYEKTATAGIGDQDAGWVDGIVFTPVTEPVLRITSVDYTPGPYVLERDRLRVTVVAVNDGTPFPAGLQWEATDIEVRLSSNAVYGDGDDTILGHFARVETFESEGRIVFTGDLALPLHLQAGNYYLMARVDPFEKIQETNPNTPRERLRISGANDVRIRRLPHLISDSVAFDSAKIYFPSAPMEIDWVLRNRGLGDVTGAVPYTQIIRLMAFARTDLELKNPIFVSNLSVFSESAYLPGVSAFHPQGSGKPIYSRVTLPSPARLLAGLGEVPHGLEEGDSEVIAKWPEINGKYVYYIAIVKDATIAIEQSSDLRTTHYTPLIFEIFPPNWQPASYSQWLASYGLNGNDYPKGGTPFGDSLSNLVKYALNLSPLAPRPNGAAVLTAFGRSIVDQEEYCRLSFNILRNAGDLRYVVEVASHPGATWMPLLSIEPPFWADHGANSLTGVGGLTSHPLILSASEQGNTVAVTVRDSIPLRELSSRFMRLRIEVKE